MAPRLRVFLVNTPNNPGNKLHRDNKNGRQKKNPFLILRIQKIKFCCLLLVLYLAEKRLILLCFDVCSSFFYPCCYKFVRVCGVARSPCFGYRQVRRPVVVSKNSCTWSAKRPLTSFTVTGSNFLSEKERPLMASFVVYLRCLMK